MLFSNNFINFRYKLLFMIFKIQAKGHENVTSRHKSTFEITKDQYLTPSGDCIVGVDMDKTMLDFPQDLKDQISDSNTKIIVELKTENGYDEIVGYGHEDLSLTHPTDIVIRKSDFTCPRTLMVNSDKAARDLDTKLIEDLKNEKIMEVTIKTCEK